MAYDEGLAQRIRAVLADDPQVSEKGMFGGVAEDADLAAWIERGVAFAGSLPPG